MVKLDELVSVFTLVDDVGKEGWDLNLVFDAGIIRDNGVRLDVVAFRAVENDNYACASIFC